MGKEWCLIHKRSAWSCCKAKLNEEVHKSSPCSIYLAEMHHIYKRAHSGKSWIWATQPSNSFGIAEHCFFISKYSAAVELLAISFLFLFFCEILSSFPSSPALTWPVSPKASSVDQQLRYGLTFPAAEAMSWSSCTCSAVCCHLEHEISAVEHEIWNMKSQVWFHFIAGRGLPLYLRSVFWSGAVFRVNSGSGWKT